MNIYMKTNSMFTKTISILHFQMSMGIVVEEIETSTSPK